jgi:hypothetical protein
MCLSCCRPLCLPAPASHPGGGAVEGAAPSAAAVPPGLSLPPPLPPCLPHHHCRNGKVVASTTVQVALPLPGQPQPEEEGQGQAQAAAQAHELVYAFLPVRAYGLPFSLHADWVVPASRQDVTGSSGWNQLLRAQVRPPALPRPPPGPPPLLGPRQPPCHVLPSVLVRRLLSSSGALGGRATGQARTSQHREPTRSPCSPPGAWLRWPRRQQPGCQGAPAARVPGCASSLTRLSFLPTTLPLPWCRCRRPSWRLCRRRSATPSCGSAGTAACPCQPRRRASSGPPRRPSCSSCVQRPAC